MGCLLCYYILAAIYLASSMAWLWHAMLSVHDVACCNPQKLPLSTTRGGTTFDACAMSKWGCRSASSVGVEVKEVQAAMLAASS